MTSNAQKISAYVGFAMRERKYRRGINGIKLLKKADLLMVSANAGANSRHDAEILSQRFKCPLIIADCGVEELTHIADCKVIALLDRNLAKAIIDNFGDGFAAWNGGNNG